MRRQLDVRWRKVIRDVIDAGVATGVQFHPTDAVAFAQALRQLVALHGDAKLWARVQKNAMAHPVGWETSAAEYAALYDGLVK